MSWHARTAAASIAGSNRSVRMLLAKRWRWLSATPVHHGIPWRTAGSSPAVPLMRPVRADASEPAFSLGDLDRFGTVAGTQLLDRGGQVVAHSAGGKVQRGRQI